MREISTFLFLGFNAWYDWRKKQISLLSVAIYGILGTGEAVWHGRMGWSFWIAIGTGGLFLGLSMLTHGDIGMGDGWVLAALGTMLDAEELLPALCIGLVCSALWALILLIVFKCRKNTEIPFVPFLLLGYIGGFWM